MRLSCLLFGLFVYFLSYAGIPYYRPCSTNLYGDASLSETKGSELVAKKEAPRLSEPDKPFSLINQDNKPVVLDDLIGKPLVMSFIYTRCPMADMCPLIMKKMVEVQKGLNKGHKDKVFFAIITFDPEYDTPEVLKEYGRAYGVDYDNLIFLTGKKVDIDYALNHFRIYYKEEAPGTISHTMETLVMDEKGVIKRIFPTSIWNPKDVIKEVKKTLSRQEVSNK